MGSFTNLWAKVIGESNEEIIYAWVSAKASLLKLEKGLIQKTGAPPVISLYEKPLEFYEEKDLIDNSNKIIADAILECWKAFGSGEMPFLGTDYNTQTFCFPCAQIKFSKKIRDKYPDLDSITEKEKFSEFLIKPIYKDGPTYNHLLKNRVFLKLNIPKDDDIYIFFVASKGSAWQRFRQSITSGQLLEDIVKIGVVTTITTRTVGGAALAVPLGYLKPFVAPGNEYFHPAIIMGDPTFISTYCNTNAQPSEKGD